MIKKTALIGTIILFTLFLIYCTADESTIIGPFGNAGKYITVLDLSADKTTVYSNGDTSTVSLKVLNVDNSPAIGLKINFTTQFGSITESDTTDSSGVATATFISDENTGTNIITVNTGVKSYTLSITVVKYQPSYLILSAESPVLLADGEAKTKITAVLKDSVGNPMVGMTVHFHTTLGDLSSPIEITDATGTAFSELTSSDTIGIATVTAESGIESSVDVKFHMDVPAFVELSVENPVLLADGIATTTLTAIVKDSTGHRMGGEPVIFTTTLGTLGEKGAISTDSDGIAKVVLTSSTESGTALIIATSFVSDSVEVEFNINVPDIIEIFASPSVILADGQSISTITAIPKDKDGNPMPGMSVSFATTLGSLKEKLVVSNIDGIAETDLVSETTDGTAYVTATSSAEATVGVQFIAYNPAYISLLTDIDGNTVLADGKSEINIIAEVYNSANQIIPWALVDFSTTQGSLNKATVRADQAGKAIVTLTSAGSTYSYPAVVTAEVQGTSISETISVKFRGISIKTHVDSVQFASGGKYKVFVRAELIDIDESLLLENATVRFNSTIGSMEDEVQITDEFGRAFSILFADVTSTDQSGLKIYAKLWFAPNEVIDSTESRVIPGVEALISTIDDEVMGDGEGWALVKATLRESSNHNAIPLTDISWSTTLGTIIGQSKTNTSGHTIDTLRIENSVSTNTNVTIIANYGKNISVSDILTFIQPVNNNRLIMGFEPDTTSKDTIPVPCDIPDEFATRDAGISAFYVNANSNPIGGQTINFSVVPNNFAAICPTTVTVDSLNGRALVMMAYPPNYAGEIVRVWAQAPDGTRGSIDVILPKDPEEDDSGGG